MEFFSMIEKKKKKTFRTTELWHNVNKPESQPTSQYWHADKANTNVAVRIKGSKLMLNSFIHKNPKLIYNEKLCTFFFYCVLKIKQKYSFVIH